MIYLLQLLVFQLGILIVLIGMDTYRSKFASIHILYN